MEKYLFESYDIVIRFQKSIINNYNHFLNTKTFWFLCLIILPAIFLYYNLFFFRESRLFFSVYFLATILLLSLLMPPIYYKVKGLDFFALKTKYFQKELDKLLDRQQQKNREIEIKPFDKSLTESLFSLMNDCHIMDETLVSEQSRYSDSGIFSQNYIADSINNLRILKYTDKYIYLTCGQKVAGYIIHEVFKPLLKIETKQLCNYFYYYKNNEFRKVNYNSISSTEKRRELSKVKNPIQDIISKSYV